MQTTSLAKKNKAKIIIHDDVVIFNVGRYLNIFLDLQAVLSHHNLLDQCISFGVAVFLDHKLLNIETIQTIDQVCLCKVIDPDNLFHLQDLLSRHNLLDQCISFGVAVFLHHKLLNIWTIQTIDQVCLCKVIDPDNLFHLQDLLSRHNLLDQCISFGVAVFLHHKLLNIWTIQTIDQVYLDILVDPDKLLHLLVVLNHYNPLVQYNSFGADVFLHHKL